MKNRLFHFLTPCMIASVGLFVMIVDSLLFLHRSKGNSYAGIIVALPYLATYIAVDYLLRRIFKAGLVTIWVIEIIIILLSAAIFANYFPFRNFTVNH